MCWLCHPLAFVWLGSSDWSSAHTLSQPCNPKFKKITYSLLVLSFVNSIHLPGLIAVFAERREQVSFSMAVWASRRPHDVQYWISFFQSNEHTYFGGKSLISHLAAIIWIHPLSHESQRHFKWMQLIFTCILVGILHLGWLRMATISLCCCLVIVVFSYSYRVSLLPCWKINSFISEISVCWSCKEKKTIKIER